MRGRSDRVVVVGAGLGGLSCALRLAGAGREVIVVERESTPGGRAGRLSLGGYEFDTGPTVLTAPGLIADALRSVGEDISSWLELTRLDPAYRAHFPDGSTLDVHTDAVRMADEVAEVCGPREADGYLRFVDYVRDLYQLEFGSFIDRNFTSPVDLLGADLVRLAFRGGFRRLSTKIGQFFRDPRTRRVFSFQAMYAGLAPHQALALYAVISYLDSVAGVYYPRGGMYAVPQAMAGAAEKHGVQFRYDTTVSGVDVHSGRAHAVITANGERISADVVVLNPDLPIAYRDLLPGYAPRRRLEYSPSCVVLHVGSRARYSKIAHHNIHFGHAWRRTFDEVIKRGELMSDPSLLVTNPGDDTYYILAPAPNTMSGIDWASVGPRYRDELVSTLESRGYVGFSDAIEVEHLVTPADWEAQGMAAGTPFAAAHTFAQTGPFRPGNLAPGLENVVFVGSGTQPGVGVPMVLVSGRLAAERITGKSVR